MRAKRDTGAVVDHLMTPVRSMALVLVALAGCAGVPEDLGRSQVDALVAERGQHVENVSEALLKALLAQPLTAEDAVRIALVNSPELQSTYAELGFAAADLYQAGRIRNPVVAAALLDPNAPGRDQLTLGIAASLTDLLTLRARSRMSLAEFSALQQSVAGRVLSVAAEAQRAFYQCVGAAQIAELRTQIAETGAVSAELAMRFNQAGNLTARELAMQRAVASEVRLAAISAAAEAFEARTRLAAVIGLSTGGDWTVRAELPLPPAQGVALESLLREAEVSRLDLAAAHARAESLADRYGVVEWTRWLGEFELGVERERGSDGVRLMGPTASWELPVFSQNRDAQLRANAEWQMALGEVRRLRVMVDNDVRLAHAALENARVRVDEYERVLIPQRKETVARGQEEVNFMLIGIFDLIDMKQDEHDAYHGYLEAVRDYWVAYSDLAQAAGRVLPRVDSASVRVSDLLQRSQSGQADHAHPPKADQHGVPPAQQQPELSEPYPQNHGDHQ